MIRAARKARGMTQEELGRAAAVGRQWIVAVEKGRTRAELGKVLQTAAALDLSLTVRGEGIREAPAAVDRIEVADPRQVLHEHLGNEHPGTEEEEG